MFQRIGALASDDPLLKWIWAIREQENLWFAHDALWVEEASAGWPDATIHNMLVTYGLLRGKQGKQLSQDKEGAESQRGKANRQRFADLAKAKAIHLQAGDSVTNTRVWQEFGNEFAESCGASPKNGWFMRSATMKAMWFHKPHIIPMYDTLAADGLAGIAKPGKRTRPQDDFLARAHVFLEQSREMIAEARNLLGSVYPYDVRILDKFLWLRGNKGADNLLRRFQSGCRGLADHA